MTNDNENPRGLPVVQRWKATGDYAYPAEEADDGEFVSYEDYAALLAEVEALRAESACIERENIEGWKQAAHWRRRADRLEEAADALEAARADADRWRYARENWHRLATATRPDGNGGVICAELFIIPAHEDDPPLTGLDAAIDAAMAAKGRE